MTQFQIVSIVSLVGFLILVLSELRSHRIGWKRHVALVGLWAAIFGIVTLVFSAIG